MKFKKIFPVSVIALSLLSCNNTNTNKINLNNFSVKDMESYSSFGVGSKYESKSDIKKKYIDSEDEITSKTTPIHFIGSQNNNELADISFFDENNNDKEFNYSLKYFQDLGGFFFFSLMDNYYDMYICYTTGEASQYVLSKKTGKIYSLDIDNVENTEINFYLTYSFDDFFYCKSQEFNKETQSYTNYYYKFSEENNTLKSERIFKVNAEEISADKFGNIMINGNIYDNSFKKIANIDKNEFSYDFFVNIFYKYNYSDGKYYYLDSEATIQETTAPNFDAVISNLEDTDLISSFTKKDSEFCKHFIKKENNISYYFNGNYMVEIIVNDNGINYTIKKYGEITNKNLYLNIINGNYLYAIDSQSNFCRYDWHNGKLEELNFEGYDVSFIEEDENGILTVKGFTDSLEQFEGYINEDGILVIGKYITSLN